MKPSPSGVNAMAPTGDALERLEIVIVNRLDEFARVAQGVDRLAERHALSAEVAADMNIALDEVLANVLSHGYADAGEHEIRITLSVHARALRAEIEDDGRPFDPLAAPPPRRAASLAESPIGGVGIHFLRSLMSEVAYERSGGKNRLVLVKAFERGS
jgi:serine/threonine-protein kinase RsbW